MCWSTSLLKPFWVIYFGSSKLGSDSSWSILKLLSPVTGFTILFYAKYVFFMLTSLFLMKMLNRCSAVILHSYYYLHEVKYSKTSKHRLSGGWKTKTIHRGKQ
jgi:hypothetical protein